MNFPGATESPIGDTHGVASVAIALRWLLGLFFWA